MGSRLQRTAVVVLFVLAFAAPALGTEADYAMYYDTMPGAVSPVAAWGAPPSADSGHAPAPEIGSPDAYACADGAPRYDGVCCGDCGPVTRAYFNDADDAYPAAGPSWLGQSLRSMQPIWTGWEVDQGLIFFDRVPPTKNEFAVFESGSPAWSANQLQLGWSAGPRIEATRRLDACGLWKANVVYYGIDSWDYQHQLSDSRISSEAKLYNVEVNVRRRLTPRLSCLAGYRWMEISDRVEWQSGSGPWYAGCKALNQMNGFQVGLLGEDLWSWRRLTLRGDLKAGVFSNRGTARIGQRGSGPLNVYNYKDRDVAFIGEIGTNLEWRPCSWLTAYVGYQSMWFDSAALATNQHNGTSVDFDDTSFYHGLRGGIVCSW